MNFENFDLNPNVLINILIDKKTQKGFNDEVENL